MVLAVRSLLVMLLVLLQGIAPLVHAHAGASLQLGSSKLHLPGLETYLDTNSSHYSCSAIEEISSEGLVISVHSGIKQNFNVAFTVLDNSCLPATPTLPKPPFFQSLNLALPHPLGLLSEQKGQPHTPRAPPYQSFCLA